MTSRFFPLSILVATLVVSTPALQAQQPEEPTPEQIEKRAKEAEEAPLFQVQDPLELTLSTDISWIRDERSDSIEVEGTVRYTNEAGEEVILPVQVRARGNFRRDKRNCNFPPLRLNFAGKEVEGSVFEGQDKLKLVTPCHDSRDSYQQYILQEYLVYRAYQLFTPTSFRVRLVHITYEDPDGGYDSRTKTGFLIESDDQMAERNRGEFLEFDQFNPTATDLEQSALVALFQYMIGNTDYSSVFFHNAVLVRQGSNYLMVPYDFDWSGVVDARYAAPDPRLGIRSVKDRLFRGFCREGVDHEALKALFNAQRDALWALYEGMPELDDGQRERALRYYERFYETLSDARRYERDVIEQCLNLPR
ncbi:MAG TPA: hypothetical protein VLA36_10325 [Longimicrobiales bacterium]|nr:hypothetical protein [Longimicrobiales bacterium]